MPPTTFLLLAAAVAVTFLLLLHLRLNRRQEALHLRFVGFEQDRKQDLQAVGTRLDEAQALFREVEEGLRPSVEGLEERLAAMEAKIGDAVSKLEAMAEASEAAGRLDDARAKLDAWTNEAEERLSGIATTLGKTSERTKDLETRIAHVRDVLGERIGRLEQGREAASPRRVASTTTAPALTEAEDDPPPSPVAATPISTRRVTHGGFTYEGEPNEPAHPGLQGVLVVMALLAGVTMLLHVLGIGR